MLHDQIFNASQHMDLCTAEVIYCVVHMGVDYVPKHIELLSLTWNIARRSHLYILSVGEHMVKGAVI